MQENKKTILQFDNTEDRTDVVDLSINNVKDELHLIAKSSNSKIFNHFK